MRRFNNMAKKEKSIEDYAVPVHYDDTPMPNIKLREVEAKMKELGRPLTKDELRKYEY